MTRFARAKGSKSSNERVPENATSWQDLKQQQQVVDPIMCEKTTAQSTLKAFKNSEKQADLKWSEFPEFAQSSVEGKRKQETIVVKKCKKHKTETVKDAESLEVSTVEKVKKKKKKKMKHVDIPTANSQPGNEDSLVESKMKPNKADNEQKCKPQAKKMNKNRSDEYKRRKPQGKIDRMVINGSEVEIDYYDGFPIKKADADRIKQLRKDMISKGLPRSEVAIALKLERRKAEKSLARERKKVCFNCRKNGHTLSECPLLKDGSDAQLMETGICFKCGSTEHTHFECRVTRSDDFKFAQCFICKEQGHIARQCPDNKKGLYPNGGSCRICGAVTHLKKDCPQYQAGQEDNKFVVGRMDGQNIESLENEEVKVVSKKKFRKTIKF